MTQKSNISVLCDNSNSRNTQEVA